MSGEADNGTATVSDSINTQGDPVQVLYPNLSAQSKSLAADPTSSDNAHLSSENAFILVGASSKPNTTEGSTIGTVEDGRRTPERDSESPLHPKRPIVEEISERGDGGGEVATPAVSFIDLFDQKAKERAEKSCQKDKESTWMLKEKEAETTELQSGAKDPHAENNTIPNTLTKNLRDLWSEHQEDSNWKHRMHLLADKWAAFTDTIKSAPASISPSTIASGLFTTIGGLCNGVGGVCGVYDQAFSVAALAMRGGGETMLAIGDYLRHIGSTLGSVEERADTGGVSVMEKTEAPDEVGGLSSPCTSNNTAPDASDITNAQSDPFKFTPTSTAEMPEIVQD